MSHDNQVISFLVQVCYGSSNIVCFTLSRPSLRPCLSPISVWVVWAGDCKWCGRCDGVSRVWCGWCGSVSNVVMWCDDLIVTGPVSDWGNSLCFRDPLCLLWWGGHTCTHTRTHPHTHTCTSTHTHIHACTCTHTHSCTYTHTHTHTHMQTFADMPVLAPNKILCIRVFSVVVMLAGLFQLLFWCVAHYQK